MQIRAEGEIRAEGTVYESPAWQCRVSRKSRPSPAGTARHLLSERLSRIEWHAGSTDYDLKLCFEITPAMVFRLVLDVIDNGRLARTAYAEGAVSLLPSECNPMLANPARRIRLHDLNGFR